MSEKNQANKLFVGGLSLDTDNDSLRGYFETYGDITDAIVMRDGATKKSRGFGFVTYAQYQSVTDCLAAKPHHLDDKEVEVKRAVPKEDISAPSSSSSAKTRKVFLGGLAPETTKDDIRVVAELFGNVTDIQIMTEKYTEKPRGFGFVIFDDYDPAQRMCDKKYHKIRDREVEVKPAVSQEEMRRSEGVGRGGSGRASNGDSYGGRGGSAGDAYGRYKSAYGASMDYRMSGGGYDYRGYDYMRGDYTGYPMFDRSAPGGYAGYGAAANYGRYNQGYDMGYGMYSQGGMGPYQQAASNYGPSRGGAYGAADKDKERGGRGGAGGGGYHPYRR